MDYVMRGSDETALVDFLVARGWLGEVTAWRFLDELKQYGFKVYYEDPGMSWHRRIGAR